MRTPMRLHAYLIRGAEHVLRDRGRKQVHRWVERGLGLRA